MQTFKTLYDKRLSYLTGLEDTYRNLGYETRLNYQERKLEVYPKGAEIPKTQEQIIIDKWIN